MDSELIIVTRYAQAFLNVFSITERDFDQIEKAISFFNQRPELFSLLKVPLLDANIKRQTLETYLLERFELPIAFQKLIGLLVSQKRSHLIIKVLSQIEILYQERQGIEVFTVTSATPFEPDDLTAVHNFLAKHTHHTIVCVPAQDPLLIAGIRMQSAEHIWEYSIRKQLAAIQAHLVG